MAATSGSFKAPSMIAQDLAIIMGFVDRPRDMQKKAEPVRVYSKGSPASESENDIASSGPESEDEVDALISHSFGPDALEEAKGSTSAAKVNGSDEEASDSDSLTSSSSGHPLQRQKKTAIRSASPALEIDLDEDGPSTATTYVPTAHELPPTAIPIPSLPNPQTLPQDPLERVGEIVTILLDSIIVRGGGSSGREWSAQERRGAVLDEGSLLLFEDRTPLGYVWETFGPTVLPHYVVRIKRRDGIRDTASVSQSIPAGNSESTHTPVVPISDSDSQSVPAPNALMTSDGPDITKLFINQTIYHIPSISNFVFTNAIAHLKGSDASNLHDEEPAEHELEFSDDEAEAAQKRLRKRVFSRVPSHNPFSNPADGDDEDTISAIGDSAGSLYGTSPYDFEDMPALTHGQEEASSESGVVGWPPSIPASSTKFEDPAVQDALMHARNSRNKRPSSASTSDISFAVPSQSHETRLPFNARGKGRGRGRGRGKERGGFERGRDRNIRSQSHGHSRRQSQGTGPENQNAQGDVTARHQGSFFSFDEYDPHMPRPPSPTSLAIARAIGQWADGTPYPYTAENASGSASANPSANYRQSTDSFQPHLSVQESYYPPGHYGYSQPQTQMYGVAPHINPRFAQAFKIPGMTQPAQANPLTPAQQQSMDAYMSHTQNSGEPRSPG